MKKLLFTILLGFCLNNCYSQVTGAAALIALDEIDATMTKQLQTIDNLATNAIGNAGNMMLSLSARLRKDINETIGNTDKVLRENQLALFNQIQNLSNDLDTAIKEDIDNIDVVATKISETLDNLLIKKKEPRIFKYETGTFIKDYSKYYAFKVKGKNFDQTKEMYVELNGKKIKPVQTNYNELVFRIDSADIPSGRADIYYADAKIVFHWHKGLFKTKKIKQEPFLIPIAPLNIGDLTVFYEQKLPELKFSDYISYSCQCSTGPSDWLGNQRRNTVAFNLNPTGGRLFDSNSVAAVSWEQRHGGGHSFDFKTEQQIKGKITCKSDGRPRGGGGFSKLTFHYREMETIYPIHKKQTATQKITSVNPSIVELPDPVDSNRPNINYALVKTFDNKEIVLTPSKADKLFDLRINPVTDDIIISWKRQQLQ
ncbi:hypothetical protein [Flavobacterium humi]|uniref:Uncharacterized protein n=1 Tax=Flavobacterium humi TaxID=2562683 RepID=A0A4Z0LC93_9FLAO|nr:hypothetical protein [Flavobacterium humi]TGD59512.1 hypothetical protein E4635_00835 [Flavobacterium humi]